MNRKSKKAAFVYCREVFFASDLNFLQKSDETFLRPMNSHKDNKMKKNAKKSSEQQILVAATLCRKCNLSNGSNKSQVVLSTNICVGKVQSIVQLHPSHVTR